MKRIIPSIFSIFVLLALPLQAREMDIPTIVGDDDREEITNPVSKQERAVVLIEASDWRCSGSIVGPNIVLTAAHCLSDDNGNPVKQIKVYTVGMPNPKILPKADHELADNPKDHDPINKNILKNEILEQAKKQQFTYPFAKAKQVWIPKRFKEGITNDSIYKYWYDYGIIILDENLGDKTGWLELKDSNEELVGTKIIVIGRGYDKPGYTLWKSPGQIGNKDDYNQEFYHNADTLHGNSGGPVFKENDPSKIIGLSNWGVKKDHVKNGYPNSFLRINVLILHLVSDRDQSWVKENYLIYPEE